MRKKTLAVLLAGAVAAAGIMGLTACKKDGGDNNGNGGNNNGNVTIQTGTQVTEEQWKAAFIATLNAENYMATGGLYSTSNASGKVGEETVNYNYVRSDIGSVYFDLTNKKILTETISTQKVTGGKLYDEKDEDKTSQDNYYYEADGLKLWSVSYSNSETGWSARSNTYSAEAKLKTELFSYGVTDTLLTKEFSVTHVSESKTVSNLYSVFTYDNGLYSATLYDEGGYENKVIVSVKDGYIIGFMYEINGEYKQGEISVQGTNKLVYLFSNYGTTSVTTPEGAAAAIAAKKTASNN